METSPQSRAQNRASLFGLEKHSLHHASLHFLRAEIPRHHHRAFIRLLCVGFLDPGACRSLSALVNACYQALYRVESEAQWLAATDVTPEHDAASETAGKARAAFNGNPAIINEAKRITETSRGVERLTRARTESVLLNAAEGPMTNPDLVATAIAAETKQASILNSFEFKLNGKPITANEIDKMLEKSTDLDGAQRCLGNIKAIRPGA